MTPSRLKTQKKIAKYINEDNRAKKLAALAQEAKSDEKDKVVE